jgi:hypothetical protein
VERLRWVLRQQREHFLPLKVIKDRLEDGTVGADGDEAANGSQGNEIEGARADTPASGVSVDAIDARVHAADAAETGPDDQARAERPAATTRTTRPERPERPQRADPPDAARRRHEPVLVGQAASVRAPGLTVSDAAASAGPGPGLPGIEEGDDGPSSGSSPSGPSRREPADGPTRASASERPRGRAATSSETPPADAPTVPDPERAAPATPDEGRSEPAAPGPGGSGRAARPGGPASAPGRSADLTGASLTLTELAAASGLGEDVLEQLREYGLLVATQVGGTEYFDEDGLAIANLAAGFARYGVEPRHLRLYKNTADREAGFIEQIVLPLVRQRNPEARQRAGRTADELTQLGQGLRSALLRSAIRDLLGG